MSPRWKSTFKKNMDQSTSRGSKLGHVGALEGKTVVTLFTQDGVREILVPSNKPNYHKLILPIKKLHYLEEKATKTEKLDRQKELDNLAKESRERKAKFMEIDRKVAKTSSKLNALEEEAKEKANSLLKRAWELRMEQEDEIKAANSLILKTKCQAIRDAQLAEKALIKKRLTDEEQRAEMAKQKEITEHLLNETRKAELLRCQKANYVNELSRQLQEINEKKIIDSQKIIQERRNQNEVMYMMMKEEMHKLRQDLASKARTREDLAIANEQIRRAHELEKEEQRLADLKVQAWMKQRAEREEALEREQVENKRRREAEIARLRAMQEKAGELQAKQDEMAAIRRQEEYEREWRKKEMLAAELKKREEDKCMEVRNRQIEEFRQIQAMEIAREKREFEHIMQLHKDSEEKERLMELKRKHVAEQFREALLRQMNQKERDLIESRAEELAEGIAIRAEDARRVDEIRRVLRDKVQQLKTNKVPEMYISDIMRQLRLSQD